MNKKQLVCMWTGIIVFVLIGLNTRTLFRWYYYMNDCAQLITCLAGTVIVTGGLIYTLRDKQGKK
jgi:bacteriorhodopsin